LSSDGTRELNRYYGWEPETGRPSLLIGSNNRTGDDGRAEFLRLTYAYDKVGNPQRIRGAVQTSASATADAAAWCYDYDGLQRLTSARTGDPDPDDEMECKANSSTAGVTGANYNLSYGYAQDRLTQVDSTMTPVGSSSYTYGAPARPHETTKVTTTSNRQGGDPALPPTGTLAYDPDGRIRTLTDADGTVTAYGYDGLGNVTSTLSKDKDGVVIGMETTNAYTANGIRIARKVLDHTANTTTTVLYLGETQITKTITTSSTSTAWSRTLTTPHGIPVATQTKAGWTWLMSDAQGSVRFARDIWNDGKHWYNYYPFGDPTPSFDLAADAGLAANAGFPAGHGFLNKTQDPDGTVRLDHRSYDAGLNILTTPDPLFHPGDPQSMNAYAYARNNPLLFTDPSGLDVDPTHDTPAPTENTNGGHVQHYPTGNSPTGHSTPTHPTPPENPDSGDDEGDGPLDGLSDWLDDNGDAINDLATGIAETLAAAAVAGGTQAVAGACGAFGVVTVETGVGAVAGAACVVGVETVGMSTATALTMDAADNLHDGITEMGSDANPGSGADAGLDEALPPGVKEGWRQRTADNGKGQVWQESGAEGNANSVRVMEPTERYPDGYVRFYNEHGQPISLNGKPGPNSETHIARGPDGSYALPEGW